MLVDDAKFDTRLTETDGEGVPMPELVEARLSQPDIDPTVELEDWIDAELGRCVYVEYGQCGRDKGEGRLGDAAMPIGIFLGEDCLDISVISYAKNERV